MAGFTKAVGGFFTAWGQKFNAFFGWVRRTLDMLCDRPDHLQRISIIGAGMSLYPLILGMIALLVFFAFKFPNVVVQVTGGLINFVYVFMGLFALVIVSMLGTIKGLSLRGIGGSGITITTTADDPDVDPTTTRDTRIDGGGNTDDGDYRGGWSGYGGAFAGRRDFVGGGQAAVDMPVDGEGMAGDAMMDKDPGRIDP